MNLFVCSLLTAYIRNKHNWRVNTSGTFARMRQVLWNNTALDIPKTALFAIGETHRWQCLVRRTGHFFLCCMKAVMLQYRLLGPLLVDVFHTHTHILHYMSRKHAVRRYATDFNDWPTTSTWMHPPIGFHIKFPKFAIVGSPVHPWGVTRHSNSLPCPDIDLKRTNQSVIDMIWLI